MINDIKFITRFYSFPGRILHDTDHQEETVSVAMTIDPTLNSIPLVSLISVVTYCIKWRIQ